MRWRPCSHMRKRTARDGSGESANGGCRFWRTNLHAWTAHQTAPRRCGSIPLRGAPPALGRTEYGIPYDVTLSNGQCLLWHWNSPCWPACRVLMHRSQQPCAADATDWRVVGWQWKLLLARRM